MVPDLTASGGRSGKRAVICALGVAVVPQAGAAGAVEVQRLVTSEAAEHARKVEGVDVASSLAMAAVAVAVLIAAGTLAPVLAQLSSWWTTTLRWARRG